MKFYSDDLKEVDLQDFEPGSLVICRVTKKMTNEEFNKFVKQQSWISTMFEEQKLRLLWCPDWLELKEWN